MVLSAASATSYSLLPACLTLRLLSDEENRACQPETLRIPAVHGAVIFSFSSNRNLAHRYLSIVFLASCFNFASYLFTTYVLLSACLPGSCFPHYALRLPGRAPNSTQLVTHALIKCPGRLMLFLPSPSGKLRYMKLSVLFMRAPILPSTTLRQHFFCFFLQLACFLLFEALRA